MRLIVVVGVAGAAGVAAELIVPTTELAAALVSGEELVVREAALDGSGRARVCGRGSGCEEDGCEEVEERSRGEVETHGAWPWNAFDRGMLGGCCAVGVRDKIRTPPQLVPHSSGGWVGRARVVLNGMACHLSAPTPSERISSDRKSEREQGERCARCAAECVAASARMAGSSNLPRPMDFRLSRVPLLVKCRKRLDGTG